MRDLPAPRVLLVEDDVDLQKRLAGYLRGQGFEIVTATRAADARATGGLAAAIVDRMLPDGDGVELVRRWRTEGVSFPILILTARAELEDKLGGLEAGATDYITKPFAPQELSARLEAQIRQHRATVDPPVRRMEYQGIELDPVTREVIFRRRPVRLTRKQFDLLRLLMEQPGRVYSRNELLDSVWELGSYPTTRTVDNHVAQLRQKLAPELLETLHGVGYRLVGPPISEIRKNITKTVHTDDKR